MKSFLLLLFVSATMFACKSPKNAAPTITRILHGTSYGHCFGYCIREEIYEGSTVTYKKVSRQEEKFPQQDNSATLNKEDFDKILGSFDYAKFKALPDRIGCPDCADGGAEYIEITSGGEVKRVEFEVGRPPEGMEKLVDILRRNREGIFPEE